MEHNGVQPDTVQKAQTEGQLLDLVKDSASNFDDGKFSWLRRVGRRGEDSEVSLDLALGSDGVQQTGNGVLASTLVFQKQTN